MKRTQEEHRNNLSPNKTPGVLEPFLGKGIHYMRVMPLILLISFSFSAFAQEQYFKIGMQYRNRAEYRNGYRTLRTDSSHAAYFIAQRARLTFDYHSKKFQIYASVQDSRTWGDEEQKKDQAGLQVNELWMEMFLVREFSLKMGRQELAYDDHRILGNLDWANLSISHDALLLKFQEDKRNFKWHLGGAFNQTGEPLFGTDYTLKNYKALGFSWIQKGFKGGHSLSGLVVVNGMSAEKQTSDVLKASYTMGPLYNYKNRGWSALLGAYYQGGKTPGNLMLSAVMINIWGEKKWKKISVGLGADYLSGNSEDTPPTQSRNFNTLYATNHKFYGYMDYFLNIPSDTKQRGLLDCYTRLGIYPGKKTLAYVDVHRFAWVHPNPSAIRAGETRLGTEADFIFDYKPNPLIHLQLGYSLLFAAPNMEYIKGGNTEDLNTWVYAMLKISPIVLLNEIKK